MYYLIDNDPENRMDTITDVLEYCISEEYYSDDDEGFSDYISETEGTVEVYGYEFNAIDVLRSDTYLYRDAIRSWAENEVDTARDSARYELEHASPGDEIYICNYTVYVYADASDTDGDEDVECDPEAIKKYIATVNELEEENDRLEKSFESMIDFQVIQ